MFKSISDFIQTWQSESASTLKLLREINNESLGQHITADSRSLGGVAWHITCSLGEMMTQAGLPLASLVTEQTPLPSQAGEIVQAYETSAKAVAKAIEENWTDAQLGDELPMYGEQWKKGFILAVLILHQSHHRGQMTMVMRAAKLKVPGVCGPSREEWAAYGMSAPN